MSLINVSHMCKDYAVKLEAKCSIDFQLQQELGHGLANSLLLRRNQLELLSPQCPLMTLI